MYQPGVLAEPTETDWRGRWVFTDAAPDHLGPVLCDAYQGHFTHDIDALRTYLLHQHVGWHRVGGDFTQPADYVPRKHQPTDTSSPEWGAYVRRNQCLCHDAKFGRDDAWIDDEDLEHGGEYAYVLGETALTVQVPGTLHGPPRSHGDKTPWWTVATVGWDKPWDTDRWDALTYEKPTYP